MVNLTLGQTKGPCSASSYQTLQTVNSVARPLTGGGVEIDYSLGPERQQVHSSAHSIMSPGAKRGRGGY